MTRADAFEAPPCRAPAPPWPVWLLAGGGVLVLGDVFDGALYRAFGSDATVLPGVPLSRLLLLYVFAAAAGLIAANPAGALRCARSAWPLWPAVGLAFASTVWSDRPATTLLWATALLGTSAFGIGLAARFSPRALAALLAVTLTAVVAISAVAALFWPAFGTSNIGWRGIFVHKNLLGRICALAIVAAAASGLRGLAAGAAFGGTAVLALSGSRGSQLAVAVALGATGLLLAARCWPRRAVPLLAGGAAIAVAVLTLLLTTAPGLALIGRSADFSSRQRIWRAVLDASAQHRILGHGYAAFWAGPGGDAVRRHFAFAMGHGHNGFIDAFAELGAIGLLLVVVPLGFVTWWALRHAIAPEPETCIAPAALLALILAVHAAEGPFLRHKLLWAVYVAIACHVAGRRSHEATDVGARRRAQ